MDKTGPELIATNELGWCVFQVPGDMVQLDFGATALVMLPADFRQLAELIRVALITLIQSQRQAHSLARLRKDLQILHIHDHQMIALYFNGALLRFQEPAFESLMQLCAEALESLDGNTRVAHPPCASLPTEQFGFSLN